MRIIALKPEENVLLDELAKGLRDKGVYVDLTRYEDGFGINVWSVDDLQCYSVTHDWPQEEKIRFMEQASHKLSGATEDNWIILETLIENFIDERKNKNIAYVDENYTEFDKTKFYLDVCGGGWVRMVSYNPDSDAGGQLVYDLLSDCDISEAGRKSTTEDEFWDHLYAASRQTLQDIDTSDFADAAKEFLEDPYDFSDQNVEIMEKLKQWAQTSMKNA